MELNPDVRGDYVDENIDQLLENSPDFFNNFTVVIGTSLTERRVPLLLYQFLDVLRMKIKDIINISVKIPIEMFWVMAPSTQKMETLHSDELLISANYLKLECITIYHSHCVILLDHGGMFSHTQ